MIYDLLFFNFFVILSRILWNQKGVLLKTLASSAQVLIRTVKCGYDKYSFLLREMPTETSVLTRKF